MDGRLWVREASILVFADVKERTKNRASRLEGSSDTFKNAHLCRVRVSASTGALRDQLANFAPWIFRDRYVARALLLAKEKLRSEKGSRVRAAWRSR